MTRAQLKLYYPDTYQFFVDMPAEHPFWVEITGVALADVRAHRTLLEDLEHVFASLDQLDGHHIFADRVAQVTTRAELMQLLTKLYVAYLYRDHGAKLVHGNEHGFDVEVQIADQLLAMGVVSFHSFDSLTDQFAAAVGDEVMHMRHEAQVEEEAIQNGHPAMPVRDAEIVSEEHSEPGAATQTPEEFLNDIEKYSKTLGSHGDAHHQVIASVSNQALLAPQTALSKHVEKSHAALAERFPMIAGVLLVDPRPGVEKTSFIPFHAGGEYLGELLDKTQ